MYLETSVYRQKANWYTIFQVFLILKHFNWIANLLACLFKCNFCTTACYGNLLQIDQNKRNCGKKNNLNIFWAIVVFFLLPPFCFFSLNWGECKKFQFPVKLSVKQKSISQQFLKKNLDCHLPMHKLKDDNSFSCFGGCASKQKFGGIWEKSE